MCATVKREIVGLSTGRSKGILRYVALLVILLAVVVSLHLISIQFYTTGLAAGGNQKPTIESVILT